MERLFNTKPDSISCDNKTTDTDRIVKNPVIGDKVVRGRDWNYADQDRDSVYGVVKSKDISSGWCTVDWIDEDGKMVSRNCYRIGSSDKFDLYYYEKCSERACTVEELSPATVLIKTSVNKIHMSKIINETIIIPTKSINPKSFKPIIL